MAENSQLALPPRWLECPRKGQLVMGKFLPFKTPLSSKYDDQIPEENRFGLDMLFLSLKAYKLKMGLLIDLTYTKRFYDSKELEKQYECKYIKLQCRGHGETPSVEQTETFVNLCDRFFRQHPLEIIGVHCTHGFNRTGFLIASYLVEKMSWSIEAAVQAYSTHRSPGIYKQDYLNELFKRYGEVEDTPEVPSLPPWHTGSDDAVDDDGILISDDGSAADGSRKRRRREFNKQNPTFADGVTGVEAVTTQPKLAQIQRRTQELAGWNTSGFPGAQPVSMDVKNIGFLTESPYKVSWKADGTRYLMLLDGKNEVYMLDRDNAVFHIPRLTFPKRKNLDACLESTLVDGEMVIDKVDGKPVPRFLIYDIIRFEGIYVGGTDFDRRLLCIQKEIINPRHTMIQQGKLDKAREIFSVRAKPFWDITFSKELVDGKFIKELSHETDGLIFQPVKDGYVCGPCKEMLKWKPPDMNSVDFKMKIVKEQRPGMLPETKGYLYVGSLEPPFSCIKVTKDLKQYDNKIIECTWEDNKWKFMRERTDKSFPNSYNTANSVCASIKNPVTKNKLFNVIDNYRWKPGPAGQQGQPRSAAGVQQHGSQTDHDLMPPPGSQSARH